MTKPTKGRIASMSIGGFVLGATLAWFSYHGMMDQAASSMTSYEPAAGSAVQIGGTFSLIDHHNQPVTNNDYDDKYKFVFFGFTHCPDVCPAGLQKISKIMDGLGTQARSFQPLFVTIDPERDTPDVMREYVAMFDDRIIGLTGSETQIKDIEDSFKVYAAKADAEDQDNYMMNHSAYIYLMDESNNLITVFGSSDAPSDVLKEIKALDL